MDGTHIGLEMLSKLRMGTLSHFSYFSYEVNANDGEAITTHGWSNSSAWMLLLQAEIPK